MNSVAEKALKVLTPIVEEAGYELIDVDYSKQYGENTLTIYIYKKGGITLQDCEKVNEAVDATLEEEDLTDGVPYNFNVSSPGLDRPIKTLDDYRRSLDTEIEIIFIQPMGKKKKVNGILIAYDETSATLKIKDREVKFDKDNFQIVRPYIKF